MGPFTEPTGQLWDQYEPPVEVSTHLIRRLLRQSAPLTLHLLATFSCQAILSSTIDSPHTHLSQHGSAHLISYIHRRIETHCVVQGIYHQDTTSISGRYLGAQIPTLMQFPVIGRCVHMTHASECTIHTCTHTYMLYCTPRPRASAVTAICHGRCVVTTWYLQQPILYSRWMFVRLMLMQYITWQMESLDIAPPDQVSKNSVHGQGGLEVLSAGTSDRLPSHPTRDGRATDSCFALIGAHQCGILMVNGGWPAASKSTPSYIFYITYS